MKTLSRVQWFEIVLYCVIFAAALLIILYTGRYIRGSWEGAMVDWLRIAPFLVVFAVNNFVLCPRLLFREKYTWYLISCLLLVAFSLVVSDLVRMLMDAVAGPPFPRPEHLSHPGPPPPGERQYHFYFGQAIVSLLLIGFNTGMKTSVRYAREKIAQGEKESQHLSTELAYLRNQISPHFFMNTLNNIHALVDIDGARAQDAIVKLSRMMRYLLYESDPERVSLSKEIGFTESYIELMRLRYDRSQLEVRFDYPSDTDTLQVPAFIFLSFVENAFKHGIRTAGGSFIHIAIHRPQEGRLLFTVKNSAGDRHASLGEGSGIGIGNIRKRLDILYGTQYTLDIHSDSDIYTVTLNIPA